MRLESLAMQVRPRLSFEALDHGTAIARHFVAPGLVAWLFASGPFLCLAVALAYTGFHVAALVVLWWFKPFYDRALLHVYANGVFGAIPTWEDTLRALPRCVDAGLVWQLTLGRLSPLRSLRSPVYQLERLPAKARRERFRVLGAGASGHAFWLMVVVLHVEVLAQLALFVLAWLLIPNVVEFDLLALFERYVNAETTVGITLAELGVWYLCMTVFEPVYAAGGFALYLNQRTLLEGWDLEIGLRRLAARLETLPAVRGP